ncbi:TetR/AcrR family transcriptional regulator [Actinoplanes sp. CA-142083]|uniref:TetR/AcrR family transcriptional regulator n=1 Tax=Actinoplanes sp. CA-142083 TaxID=3239903 RepID=UPI003D8DF4F9
MTEVPLSWEPPRPERADAARNRRQLLDTARLMLAEAGPDNLTMDALAERSGLGKGTVFRRFRTRAGIFQALLDDSERELQQHVLSGPPPLGPGAPPIERLIAYGRARVAWLFRNRDVARFTLDGRQPIPGPAQAPASQIHIQVLLREMSLPGVNLGLLAVQLTAALDGPLLLYLSAGTLTAGRDDAERELGAAWQNLVERVCRP